jgi:hypothetical protein
MPRTSRTPIPVTESERFTEAVEKGRMDAHAMEEVFEEKPIASTSQSADFGADIAEMRRRFHVEQTARNEQMQEMQSMMRLLMTKLDTLTMQLLNGGVLNSRSLEWRSLIAQLNRDLKINVVYSLPVFRPSVCLCLPTLFVYAVAIDTTMILSILI